MTKEQEIDDISQPDYHKNIILTKVLHDFATISI